MIKFITALELFQIHSGDISPFLCSASSAYCFSQLIYYLVSNVSLTPTTAESCCCLGEYTQRDTLHLSATDLEKRGQTDVACRNTFT